MEKIVLSESFTTWLNLGLIVLSWLLTEIYTLNIKHVWGRQQSISASANLVKDSNDRSPVFFWIYIVPLTIPMMYVTNHPLTWIAAAVLLLIGLATGYNLKFMGKDPQNFIHVACVYISIALFQVWIFTQLLWWGLIPVGITFAIVAYMLIKKVPQWTWQIEKIIMYQVYIVALYLHFLVYIFNLKA